MAELTRKNTSGIQVKNKDSEKYFNEGVNWEKDVIKEALRSRKIAWWVAIFACFLSFLLTLAVVLLTPLKTIEPIIIETNKVTGEVTVRQNVTRKDIPQQEAINKYFIHKYIQAREGYDRNDVDNRYDIVTTMSDTRVAHEYAGTILPNRNDNSPITIFGENGVIKVAIHNISFISDNTAIVRITKNGEKPQKKYSPVELNVTITFNYLDTPSLEFERFITPLGFVVTRYRIDPVLPNS
jgi:type IV secretion system protein VirB8